MTDLLKKEKILAIICYIAYSVVLAYQRRSWFSLIFFGVIALVILFADQIICCDVVKNKTLCAFFVTSVGYQTMFEIFYNSPGNLQSFLSATAIAIFFACTLSSADNKSLSYCIVASPVLCVLNLKIAVVYSVFLLCNAIVNIQIHKHTSQKKKKKSNQILSPEKLWIISAITGVVCIGICVFLSLGLDGYLKENFNYLLVKFKNSIALIIVAVYLAVRIFKSDFPQKASVGISLVIFMIATVFATIVLGWSVFALFCFCVPAFLSLICLKHKEITEAVKTDYKKNKYLFWVLIVCMLQ
ncbi:MAG: hypothetical protein IJ447_04790 [Clostridia bacterium]|nr:hypothetical protein [Clostridia bacterium]